MNPYKYMVKQQVAGGCGESYYGPFETHTFAQNWINKQPDNISKQNYKGLGLHYYTIEYLYIPN